MRKLHLVSYTLNVVALIVAGLWYVDHESNAPLSSRAKASTAVAPSDAGVAPPAAATPSHAVVAADADAATKIKSLVQYLRSAGYHSDTLTAIARMLLRQEFLARQNAILHSENTPLWQSHHTFASPEQQAQLTALGQTFETELRDILGPSYDAGTTARDAGLLLSDLIPDAKKAAIAQIASDYQAARIAARGTLSPSARQQLDAKKDADIRAVLSPDEMQEYLMYNSSLASSVQGMLGNAPIDDATYRKIVSAVSDYRRSSGLDPFNGNTNGDFQTRLGEFQTIRPVVGDTVASQISTKGDGNFREIGAVLTSAGDTPGTVADKYEEYLRFHAALGLMSQPETRAAAAQRTYDVLTAGLSDDAKRQFDATRTGAYLARTKPKP